MGGCAGGLGRVPGGLNRGAGGLGRGAETCSGVGPGAGPSSGVPHDLQLGLGICINLHLGHLVPINGQTSLFLQGPEETTIYPPRPSPAFGADIIASHARVSPAFMCTAFMICRPGSTRVCHPLAEAVDALSCRPSRHQDMT